MLSVWGAGKHETFSCHCQDPGIKGRNEAHANLRKAWTSSPLTAGEGGLGSGCLGYIPTLNVAELWPWEARNFLFLRGGWQLTNEGLQGLV